MKHVPGNRRGREEIFQFDARPGRHVHQGVRCKRSVKKTPHCGIVSPQASSRLACVLSHRGGALPVQDPECIPWQKPVAAHAFEAGNAEGFRRAMRGGALGILEGPEAE